MTEQTVADWMTERNALAVLFRLHPRPWTVVDEGTPGGSIGAITQDPESDLYVLDAYGEVIANLGGTEDARAVCDGLVALSAAATVEPRPLRVIGTGPAYGYIEFDGRLFIVGDEGHVEVADLRSYGSIEAWESFNAAAIQPVEGARFRGIVRRFIDAGFDAIDPTQAAIDAALASGEADIHEWTALYAVVLGAIADAMRSVNAGGPPVALVVNVPQALADLADANCDTFDGVRVVNHPDKAREGEQILHLGS